MTRETILSTAEVAQRLGMARVTVQLWCRQGRLRGAFKVGRAWVVPAAALVDFVKPKAGRPPEGNREE